MVLFRISAEGNPDLLNKFNSSTASTTTAATTTTITYNNDALSQPPIKKLKIPTSALRQQAVADDSDSGSSSSAVNKKKAGTTSPTTNLAKAKSRTGTGNKKRANTTSNLTTEPISPVADETAQQQQTTPKKTKVKIVTNGDALASFECTEPNCRKRYKNKNGLSYHQRTAHTKKMDSFEEKVNFFFPDITVIQC